MTLWRGGGVNGLMTHAALADAPVRGQTAGVPASPALKVRSVVELQPEVIAVDPVVVHVRCAPWYSSMVRIWPSTFLLDRDSSFTSELIGCENISLYPQWHKIPPGREHVFTLRFQPMPRSVKVFDLAEIIPEPRGWRFPGIRRKPKDVYWVDLPN